MSYTLQQLAQALGDIARGRDASAVAPRDFQFGWIRRSLPPRDKGETLEAYQSRIAAWQATNPPAMGVLAWNTVKLGNQPTLAEIEAAAAAIIAPTPQAVGAGQIRVAMRRLGYAADEAGLNTLVEEILSGISDEEQKADALLLWRYASEFQRSHPFIAVVQAAKGKTKEEIDQLFRLAATI